MSSVPTTMPDPHRGPPLGASAPRRPRLELPTRSRSLFASRTPSGLSSAAAKIAIDLISGAECVVKRSRSQPPILYMTPRPTTSFLKVSSLPVQPLHQQPTPHSRSLTCIPSAASACTSPVERCPTGKVAIHPNRSPPTENAPHPPPPISTKMVQRMRVCGPHRARGLSERAESERVRPRRPSRPQTAFAARCTPSSILPTFTPY
jgi:hypothetical protein